MSKVLTEEQESLKKEITGYLNDGALIAIEQCACLAEHFIANGIPEKIPAALRGIKL